MTKGDIWFAIQELKGVAATFAESTRAIARQAAERDKEIAHLNEIIAKLRGQCVRHRADKIALKKQLAELNTAIEQSKY